MLTSDCVQIIKSSVAILLLRLCGGDAFEECKSRIAMLTDAFGTNTAYRLIHDKQSPISWIPQDCQPLHLWMYIRHGTRFPKEQKIVRYRRRLEELRQWSIDVGNGGKLCPSELEYMKNWTFFDLHPSVGHHLAAEGEREMESLGKRIRAAFSDFEVEDSQFHATPTQRAVKSGEFFMMGFLGSEEASGKRIHVVTEGDEVLRPYKTCQYWIDNVKHEPSSKAEYERFLKSEPVERIRRNFVELFGIPDEIVTPEDVILAHNVCGFETAWNFTGNASVWCAPFSSQADLNAMEYLEDLDRWHVHAHGNKINSMLACETAKNIVDSFRASALDRTFKAKFHFTHCGALQKLIARLRLFEDDHVLKAGDYPGEIAENRIWRGSKTTPFGANIALVLYNCAGSLKVGVYANEQLMRVPFCSSGLCDLEEFSMHFAKGYCHIQSLCGSNSALAYAVAAFVVGCTMFVAVNSMWSRDRGLKKEL